VDKEISENFPNAGNFQEYTYECEWIESDLKAVHKTTHLVSEYERRRK